MERIVKRSELRSDTESPPLSPDPETLHWVKSGNEIEFVEYDTAGGQEASNNDRTVSDEELDFQLFAPNPEAGKSLPLSSAPRIRLHTPEPANTEPGFVNPNRSPTYYFTKIPTGSAKQAIDATAVTGDDVLARSKSIWPGSSYDWRVLHIAATRKLQRSLQEGDTTLSSRLSGPMQSTKHTRPGKTARLKKRTRLAAIKVQKEQERKATMQKEAAELEKRTRRNREKKIKKKARDRAKKSNPSQEISDVSPG